MKNRETSELINFQKEIGKLRGSFDKLSAEQTKNGSDRQDNNTRSNLAIELAAFGVWEWDIRANQIFYSARWKEMLGYPDSEIGDTLEEWVERIHHSDLKSVLTLLTDHLKGETISFSSEHRILCKNQVFKWILSEGKVTASDDRGNPVRIIGINTDITQRKNTEFDLRERLKELNCHNQMSEIISDLSLTAEDVINQIVRIIPGSWQFPEMAQACVTLSDKIFKTAGFQKSTLSLKQGILAHGNIIGEVTVCYPDGQRLDAEQIFLPEESLLLFSIASRIGNFVYTKEKEFNLLDNEIRYRDLIENINDVIFEIDKQGFITFISSPVFKIFGYTADEITGKNFIRFVGENGQFLLKRLNELSDKIELKNEYQIRTKTGETRWIQMSSRALFSDGNFKGGAGTIIDITKRKLSEEKIEKLNRLYSVISHVSQAIIHIRDKQELMNEVCRIAVEFGKFRMAWIGLIDEETKIVKPFAKAGVEDGYLSLIKQISVSDVPEGRGPTGTAIRKGDHFICDNIETNQTVSPWRSEALKRDYHSSMALPLKQSGKIIGAFSLYASQPYFFDQEEVGLLDDFVNEISFAFETIETDIVRLKAEEQLRKLYRAVEQSPVSIVISDLEGIIEYANPKASTTTGYSFGELIGKNPRVLKSGETSDLEYQKLWEDIISGKEWHGIFHNKRKSGELYWESSTISPIVDHQGKITHFLAVKEDITDQKIAEQEILKFRTIAEQANYGSAITTLDGRILYINAAFAHMHGYEPNELLGKNLGVFHNEEQLPKVSGLLDQLKTNGSFSVQEVGHTRKDGSIFPTLMNASLIFDQNNVPQFLSATAIDITKLKEQEEALLRNEEDLNNAQELAHLGSWEHSFITGKLTGSKNYYRMLGLQPEEKIDNLYEYFISCVYPEDLPLIEFLQNHQYHENDMQVKDIRVEIPGVGLRWIQNNVVPVFENGRMIALRGVNMDVTEKKKIMEDLITAKEQAEESDKLKTSFLNNISHEIRTPFNGILGFLSMLQYDDLNATERDEYIDIINQSADRLMNTINDIVDLSQIQTGLMKLSVSETDIRTLVDELAGRLKLEADKKGLKFNVNYDLIGSGEHFSTDSKKLTAILSHLIGNAIKFTRTGSIELSILGNYHNLEFCVKDTGIGISKDKQELIFSQFIQADHSSTRKFEGSGLGLTIARAYVEMLKGKLWLESEEGIGSSFYFNIPNSTISVLKEMIIAPQHVLQDDSTKKLKILIAEDDEASALFLSVLVKPFSKEILKVNSGHEAVETCRINPDLDLILMDIRMPVMNGYEATRQIRKFNSNVVIIAQTAFALSGDNEKSLDAGCNDYISKPIHKDKLQMLILNFFP
ncbi:MAG: PAS domain S-box protein [Mariniphaga sp.]